MALPLPAPTPRPSVVVYPLLATVAVVALTAAGFRPAGASISGPAATAADDEAPALQQSVVSLEVSTTDGRALTGSGFFVSTDGRVVTSAHVVKDARSISATTADGKSVAVVVVAVDPALDVAELAANVPSRPLPLATHVPRPGSTILIAGDPGGSSRNSTSSGRVVASGRTAATADGRVYTDLIETDARSAPGSSGGPAVDATGAVIGIETLGSHDGVHSWLIPVTRFRADVLGWSSVTPASAPAPVPVPVAAGYSGDCGVTGCSASVSVVNHGAAGRVAATFDFFVRDGWVASCTGDAQVAAGETASIGCTAAIDLSRRVGATFRIAPPRLNGLAA